jgi:hypothetical protein
MKPQYKYLFETKNSNPSFFSNWDIKKAPDFSEAIYLIVIPLGFAVNS